MLSDVLPPDSVVSYTVTRAAVVSGVAGVPRGQRTRSGDIVSGAATIVVVVCADAKG
jgi:hypothetical protein